MCDKVRQACTLRSAQLRKLEGPNYQHKFATSRKSLFRFSVWRFHCSRGPQKSISIRCGDFIVVWKKFWNDNYILEVELLQNFLQLRKLSRAVCCTGLMYGIPVLGCWGKGITSNMDKAFWSFKKFLYSRLESENFARASSQLRTST